MEDLKAIVEARRAASLANLKNLRTGQASQPETPLDVTSDTQPVVEPSRNLDFSKVAPKPVNPDSIPSAIGRGVDSMQANLGGAVEVVGELTGSEFLQEAGDQYRKEQKQEASQYGTPSVATFSQVDWQNPDSVSTYLTSLGFGAAAPLAVGVTGAIGGAKVGGAVAGKPGAVAGGVFGALLSSLPINIGDVQNTMKEVDPEGKAPWTAVLGGTAMSSLDVVGITSIAKPLVKVLGAELTQRALVEQGIAKEAAINAVKGALAESTTAVAQEGIKTVAVAEGTDTSINTEKMIEDMLNAAVGGGLGGSTMGAAVGGYSAVKNNELVAGLGSEQATFNSGRKEELNFGQRVWETLGGSAADNLAPLARNSESFKKIYNTFRPDRTGETASGRTIFEDGNLLAGKWMSAVENGLRGKDVDVVLEQYLDGIVNPETDAIRNSLKDVIKEAEASGMDVGVIRDYLPTRLDRKKIEANQDAFLNDVRPYVKDPEQALADWLTLTDRENASSVPRVDRAVVVDPATGRVSIDKRYQKGGDDQSFRSKVGQGTVPPKFTNLEHSRAFGAVPQKLLQKYTKEQSAPEVMNAIRDYFEGASHRIAFSKAFGAGGEKLNFEVVKGIDEARKAGREPSSAEIDRIYNLADAYNGLYNNISNETTRTAMSVVGTVATLKSLPLAALSSLVEIATPAIRGDVKTAIAELLPTIGQIASDSVRGIFRGYVPRSEFGKFASEMNLTLSAASNVAASRLGPNIFGRTSATITRGYFMANGLTFVTQALTTYSARVGDRIFRDNLQLLASGVPITSPKGARAARQLRSLGVDVNTNRDAQILANPKTDAQRAAYQEVRKLAVRRFKDQTILEPNIADTPMWNSDGRLQLFAMLGRYPAAFGNTILPHLARRFSTSWAGSRYSASEAFVGTMFLIGAMLTVGAVQDELKNIARNASADYDDDRTEVQKAMDILNQTVMPMQLSRVTDFVAAPRYGRSGADTFAGPAVGMGVDLGKTINTFAANPSEGEIWKYLFKQTPLQVIRPLREQAGEFELFDDF